MRKETRQMPKKSSIAPPAAAPDKAAALDEKYARLNVFRVGLTADILKQESDPTFRHKTYDRDRMLRCAEHLANGACDLIDFEAGSLIEQRDACDEAITRVTRLAVAAHFERSERLYEENKAEWRELQRQRALLIVALRTINRKIDELRDTKIKSMGQCSNIPGDGWANRLFGKSVTEPGQNGRQATIYLNDMVREGIITEAEAELK
jgi:hypothetical protein